VPSPFAASAAEVPDFWGFAAAPKKRRSKLRHYKEIKNITHFNEAVFWR
jgi:hypothetical protein